jgi:periplasmic divalent cation tolerance protein
MSAVFAYVTAGSPEEADRLARTIVAERLAACANVIPGMRSVYWWEGELSEAAETVVVFKTRSDRFEALAARVKSLHSYECPCVVALPVTAGLAPYLEWIHSESTPR